jgi:uncharacterized DUF497 family protein
MLGFDWDDANREHIARHGVSYEEAEEAFGGTTLELGYEVVDGEERLEEVGKTAAGRILYLVTVLRGELIRVVTAFDAPRAMRLEYYRREGMRDE